MALKIVGRSSRVPRDIQVSERREKVAEARGATLRCESCNRDFAVVFPYGCTPLKRQQLVKKAADEHRKIGCVGAADLGRKFEISYRRA